MISNLLAPRFGHTASPHSSKVTTLQVLKSRYNQVLQCIFALIFLHFVSWPLL